MENSDLTEKEKAIYLCGLLGYTVDSINTAIKLLKENDLEDLRNLYYDIELFNTEYNTCSSISLAGDFPKIKTKNGCVEAIDLMVKNNNISIDVF